ncbi:MAG: tetratricopeptide repeat protein, partial [Candidatus Saccharibacteria bacterium]|nr:tetratricopeptide repeat protein [Moraxellaceae bacterium]
TGILLALIAFFGWHYWEKRQDNKNIETMNQYQKLITESEGAANDKAAQSRFISNVQALVKSHPDSVFALQALLLQAKVTSAQGEWTGAEKALTQAVSLKVEDKGLVNIGWLRLARVQAAQNKFDAALASLKKVSEPAFLASSDELRGDIFVQKNDLKAAKAAYESAWAALVKRQQSRELLKVKMNAIGLVPTEITPPNPIRETPQISATPTENGAAS